MAPVLARSALAAGADGLFIETHPDPDAALSDGPNMIPLRQMPRLLAGFVRLHETVRALPSGA
jgi:2-dehydro-3-deoxyphosphooctonate aldolase (KDO 8-P synthase)